MQDRTDALAAGKKNSSSSSADARVNLAPGDAKVTTPAAVRSSPSTSTSEARPSTEERSSTSTSTNTYLPNLVCNRFRNIVSQNRRRWQQDGFDLDLTYITDRIIAMGYPADTTEAIYRNSMAHTVKFLEERHKEHYKVFNLRGQYVYDTSKFHHRVMSFEMTDHHPPRLELMAPFCREVHNYLQADPKNVVAVHCKAGKGRTGVMICAYLVYINFYPYPRQNMDYYSVVRTHNNKGVTIPSQRRYVYYFSHLRNNRLNYIPLRIELVGVFLERPPKVGNTIIGKILNGGLNIRVANGDVDVFLPEDLWLSDDEWATEEEVWTGVVSHGPDSYNPSNPQPGNDCLSRRAWGWVVPPEKPVFLEGDVRVDVFSRQKVKLFNYNQDRKKLGHVWFNTMFACPGFCGGLYQHGDEAYPYPEDATTIAEKRTTPHRPKAGSASLPSSPPGTPKARSTGSVSNTSARGAANRAPSFGKPTTSAASGSSAAPPAPAPRGHRLSSAVRMISEATSRNSEPQIDRNAEERRSGGRRGKKTKESKGESSKGTGEWDEDNTNVLLPPGLDDHCPKKYLPMLFKDEIAPRVGIEQMLRNAHKWNLVEDGYNKRRLSVPQEGEPVAAAPEGRATGGPMLVRRRPEEHVMMFSTLEIDRAFKNKNIDPGFKLIIVTRCVPAENDADNQLADSFMRETHNKQAHKDRSKQEKIQARQRKIQGVSSGASLSSEPSGTAGPVGTIVLDPNVTGGEAELTDIAFRNDPRLNDPYMCKFFHRQRSDSKSKYPSATHRCPLLSSSDRTDRPDLPPQMKEALDGTLTRVKPSITGGDWSVAGVESMRDEMSDLDVEVRSYHPEDSNWAHSQSSRSSTSSCEGEVGDKANTSTLSAPPASGTTSPTPTGLPPHPPSSC